MVERAALAFLGALSRLLSVPGPRLTGLFCRAAAGLWGLFRLPPWGRVWRDLAALEALGVAGDSAFSGFNLVRGVIEHHLRVVCETFTMGRLNRRNVSDLVPVEGREHLDRVLKRGRGAVLLIAHYGNWEVMGVALAYHGFPIHSFFMDQRIPGFEEFLRRIRVGAGIGLVDRDDLKKALRVLKNNAILGVVADQDGGSGGVSLRLLGRPVSAPRGPAALTRISGAGVVPTVIRRTGDWRFVLQFLPEIDKASFKGLGKEAFDDGLTALFYRHYEELILGDPLQWLWFYDRFKPRRHVAGPMERMPAWVLALYGALQIPVLALLSPLLIPLGFRRGDLPGRFREYMGFHRWPSALPLAPGAGPVRINTLLVHGVSVGEIKVLQPLLAALRTRLEGPCMEGHWGMNHGASRLRILVTTTCPDGIEMAENQLVSKGLAHGVAYFPLDLPGVVNRFLSRTAPDAVVISETDLWPNFLYSLKSRKIPAILYNGRISEGIASVYGFARPLSRALLTAFDTMFVQTRQDWERLVYMAADPRRVVVTGNAKFDMSVAANSDETLAAWAGFLREPAVAGDRALARTAGRTDQPILIWGSTHPADERLLLAVLQSSDSRLVGLRHIVAPRKTDRSSEIFALAAGAGARACTLSEPDPSARVMVIDRIGILAGAYSLGTAAWIGGGYEPEGVHSIVEPLLASKPVAYGSNRKNFLDVAEEIEALGFGRAVPSEAETTGKGGSANPDCSLGLEIIADLVTPAKSGLGGSVTGGICSFVESKRGSVARQAEAVWNLLFPSGKSPSPDRDDRGSRP